MVANLKRMMQSMSSLARTSRKTGKSRITKKPRKPGITRKPRNPRITRKPKKPRQTIPISLLNLLLANKKCLIFSTNFNTMSAFCNYSAIMNVEYQELINVALWQKGSKWHSLPKFVCVCLCNFLIINSRLYALSLNSYCLFLHQSPTCEQIIDSREG